ncbi:hypothetical protein DFAR_390009 [Desulfarculales bacterium]
MHLGSIQCLTPEQTQAFHSPRPMPIGQALSFQFFNIFDTAATLDDTGPPRQKRLPYMKHIVSAVHSPVGLKAAIIKTSLNYNALTDVMRSQVFMPYDFVSFTGIFIGLYDEYL